MTATKKIDDASGKNVYRKIKTSAAGTQEESYSTDEIIDTLIKKGIITQSDLP